MSYSTQIILDDISYMPLSGCKYCGLDNPCIWRLNRDELIEYYLDCQRRGKGFGELGCVDSCNKGARKVMCQKLNMLLRVPLNKPSPTCVVNALSYVFPSTAFQDGTQLPDFLEAGERITKKSRQSYLMEEIVNSNNSDTD